jgi:hypothetical protein
MWVMKRSKGISGSLFSRESIQDSRVHNDLQNDLQKTPGRKKMWNTLYAGFFAFTLEIKGLFAYAGA